MHSKAGFVVFCLTLLLAQVLSTPIPPSEVSAPPTGSGTKTQSSETNKSDVGTETKRATEGEWEEIELEDDSEGDDTDFDATDAENDDDEVEVAIQVEEDLELINALQETIGCKGKGRVNKKMEKKMQKICKVMDKIVVYFESILDGVEPDMTKGNVEEEVKAVVDTMAKTTNTYLEEKKNEVEQQLVELESTETVGNIRLAVKELTSEGKKTKTEVNILFKRLEHTINDMMAIETRFKCGGDSKPIKCEQQTKLLELEYESILIVAELVERTEHTRGLTRRIGDAMLKFVVGTVRCPFKVLNNMSGWISRYFRQNKSTGVMAATSETAAMKVTDATKVTMKNE